MRTMCAFRFLEKVFNCNKIDVLDVLLSFFCKMTIFFQKTLARWCVNCCIANLLRPICTEFYYNEAGFVEDMMKIFQLTFFLNLGVEFGVT